MPFAMQPQLVGNSPVLPISQKQYLFIKKCLGRIVFHKWKNLKIICPDIFQLKFQFQTTPLEINTSPRMLKLHGLIAASFDFLAQFEDGNKFIVFASGRTRRATRPQTKEKSASHNATLPVGYSPVLPISPEVQFFPEDVWDSLFFKNGKISKSFVVAFLSGNSSFGPHQWR